MLYVYISIYVYLVSKITTDMSCDRVDVYQKYLGSSQSKRVDSCLTLITNIVMENPVQWFKICFSVDVDSRIE